MHSEFLMKRRQRPHFFKNVIDGLKDRISARSPGGNRAPPKNSSQSLLSRAALDILHKTNPDYDNHLFYTGRLALRNILRNESVLKEAISKQWDKTDAGLIAGVMVDVNSPDAAVYLANFMKEYKLPDDRVPSAIERLFNILHPTSCSL